MDTTERDKVLTEKVLKGCWHEKIEWYVYKYTQSYETYHLSGSYSDVERSKNILRCTKCHRDMTKIEHPDFSSWPGFGLLKEAVAKWSWEQKDAFYYWLANKFYDGEVSSLYNEKVSEIYDTCLTEETPTRFADALYSFLKETK